MTERETYGIIGSSGQSKRSAWNALTPESASDLVGRKFTRLMVLCMNTFDKAYTTYDCVCECGNKVTTTRQRLLQKSIMSCGCLRRETSRRPRPQFRGEDGQVGFRRLVHRYKKNAAVRGYTFELGEEEFQVLTKQDCYYCGQEPSQQEKDNYGHSFYLYNGIDRKDNAKGYVLENCVPCCKACNIAKGVLSSDEYIEHCRKVVENAGRA